MSRRLPDQIVSVLLEADDDEIADFVAHGLGQTDPFSSLGTVHIGGVDNRRIVNHNYQGKLWRVNIVIDYNPVNQDLRVEATVDANLRVVNRTFASYWTLPKEYLGKANEAVIQLAKDFHHIADTMPVPGWNEYHTDLMRAGDEAMLRLDDEFYQFDTKI